MFIDPGIQVYEGMMIGEHTAGTISTSTSAEKEADQHPRRREG